MSTNQMLPDRNEGREQMLEILLRLRVSDLRDLARRWGWSVKGNSKQAIVEQLADHFANPDTMRPVFERQPPTERAVMQLGDLAASLDPNRLAEAAGLILGQTIAPETVAQLLASLQERLLLVSLDSGTSAGDTIPLACQTWVPSLSAPGIVHHAPLDPLPFADFDELLATTDRLVGLVAHQRPKLARPLDRSWFSPAAQVEGPLSNTVLGEWGYRTAAERSHVRFLASLLIEAGIISLANPSEGRLIVTPEAQQAWLNSLPEEALMRLQSIWLQSATQTMNYTLRMSLFTSYLDLEYALEQAREASPNKELVGRTGQTSLWRLAVMFRAWLLGLLVSLEADTWYSLEGFLALARILRPNPLQWDYDRLEWFQGNKALPAGQKMNAADWGRTYGACVRYWLTGPASWMGIVQLARDGKDVAAFRRPSTRPAATLTTPPRDSLIYADDDTCLVRNLRAAAPLHRILCALASESGYTPERTRYRIDAASIRNAFLDDVDIDKALSALAAAGFRMPNTLQQRLATWRQRLGRYQLYDRVAAIEVNDGPLMDELQRSIGSANTSTYRASPHCLLLFDVDRAFALPDELRSKGYWPKRVILPELKDSHEDMA